ncbi:site-2 protease family protein [uncultured Pontibacter sp.]|uniref:site-2 protease family protein n=1 Tax=uncultured Pontibacter sp. TaxID=453356 RepID=UPI00263993CE|nr:site-2 protease family protein [uncultured Pontibacter sp.]
MFTINDIPKFILAFFLVLPLITFIHEAGHVFFAWLMGGKNIKVTIGTGKVLFRLGLVEVRKYYFWYGLCSFDNLKRNERLANILIFSGGILFNSLTTLLVMYLIENGSLQESMLTYQFTYFSLYFIFFAVLPMPYPDGNYSDGKIILDLIRHKTIPGEQVYRIQWSEEKSQWSVLDQEQNELHTFAEPEEAVQKAKELAVANRPSRLLHHKSEKEIEEYNFPRIPQ